MTKPGFKWKRQGFVDAMRSKKLIAMMQAEVEQAKAEAERASDYKLHFGRGVDVGKPEKNGPPGAAHGWVGASSVIKKTGKVNSGLHDKQEEALKAVGWTGPGRKSKNK